eukprot:TRINITY_DN1312_c0_g2_i1.p1 TRINITY_DN1312_c0_g2~~TRINITY_DN1312_c0_g2_i1.p1  ORF type:complete len:187 (-),score=6.76 TRINITY_DN1312_c0_g2_i1:2516-3076(-)
MNNGDKLPLQKKVCFQQDLVQRKRKAENTDVGGEEWVRSNHANSNNTNVDMNTNRIFQFLNVPGYSVESSDCDQQRIRGSYLNNVQPILNPAKVPRLIQDKESGLGFKEMYSSTQAHLKLLSSWQKYIEDYINRLEEKVLIMEREHVQKVQLMERKFEDQQQKLAQILNFVLLLHLKNYKLPRSQS